jgi:chemotaxis protein methyltransferase CheR
MALIEVFRRDDPPASIIATDVDADALAAARRGEYDERVVRSAAVAGAASHPVRPPDAGGLEESEMSGLSPERCAHFFARTEDARWRVTPAVRRLVEFREVNLVERSWPIEGRFDVIFCRNVLMYLEDRHRHAVLERMAALLAPDGLLMLDPTEHLGKAGHLFTSGAGGLFSLRCDSTGRGVTPVSGIPLQ